MDMIFYKNRSRNGADTQTLADLDERPATRARVTREELVSLFREELGMSSVGVTRPM